VTLPLSLSRRSAIGILAGGLIGGARAETNPGADLDLSGTTLRVAYYKGGWHQLVQAAGEEKTPYKIEWKELNNGVLHIEAKPPPCRGRRQAVKRRFHRERAVRTAAGRSSAGP